MNNVLRFLVLSFEDLLWNLSCRYNFWLFGPYGLAGVIARMPSRFTIKYLKKYGATIGADCLVEKGINLHRPDAAVPFRNLVLASKVYIGHKTIIDLSRRVTLHKNVIIGSGCMLWTHTSDYTRGKTEKPAYFEDFGEIEILENSLIYSGVIISHGITIGRNVTVGAASMVNKSLEDNFFYGGVPAKKINARM